MTGTLKRAVRNIKFRARMKSYHYWEMTRGVLKTWAGAAGAGIVAALVAVALLAPLIAPYDPYELVSRRTMELPSRAHLLGTDQLGRDVLSRLIYGTRTALFVGCVTPFVAMVLGLILGVTGAYFGGLVDYLVILLFDVLRSFPSIILVLALVAITGPSIVTMVLCMAITIMSVHGRVARAKALSIREEPFVEAEKVLGASGLRIAMRHIVPHVISPLIVMVGMDVPLMIAMEAGLSFLGLGVRPPQASWGNMLRVGFDHLLDAPLVFLWPALMLIVTAVGFALLSEGLRRVLDPEARIEQLSIRR